MDETKVKFSRQVVQEAYAKLAEAGFTDEEIAQCFDAAAEATRAIEPAMVLLKLLKALS